MSEIEELERSSFGMNPEDFKVLLDLCEDYPWVKREYKGLISLWNDFSDSLSRSLVVDLVKRFCMLTSYDMRSRTEEIANHIQNVWGLTAKETTLIAVSDDFEVDGSQAFLQVLKNDFSSFDGWSEKNFRNSLAGCRSIIKSEKRYVLFDDFFGTGRTIVRKAESFLGYVKDGGFENVKVYLVAVAGMESSREKIDSIGLEYFSPVWLKKGISDFYDLETAQKMKLHMKGMEKSLGTRHNGQFLPSMGYGSSESLFSIHNSNCPNNVFPIFWWPVDSKKRRRNTLLRRLR